MELNGKRQLLINTDQICLLLKTEVIEARRSEALLVVSEKADLEDNADETTSKCSFCVNKIKYDATT
jgi:hypothetical protein